MTVCFFGAYDPGYPRNRILREGLRLAGIEVPEARVRGRRVLFRYPALALAFARRARRAGVMLVPEFGHKDMPLARLLAGRRPVVFDPLVSRHDTLVGDWGLHAEHSFQARWVFEPELHLCAVPRGDAAALAAALSRLVRDAALRERLGSAGRARALEIATPERIGAGLREALERLEAVH